MDPLLLDIAAKTKKTPAQVLTYPSSKFQYLPSSTNILTFLILVTHKCIVLYARLDLKVTALDVFSPFEHIEERFFI